jgi:hypothetical protein
MSGDYAKPIEEIPLPVYQKGFDIKLKGEVDRPVIKANEESVPRILGLAPKKTHAPSAGVCVNPKCKTKFSDRVPHFCPECGMAQTVQQQG